jgi:hypothetical protein
MMNNFCAKHGNYCGEKCNQCIKIKEIHKNIVKEYKEKFTEKERSKFSQLWNSHK